MSLMDFTLPASDPNNPNAIIPPDAIKQRRLLAAALMKQGSDTSPIRSPWQGAARLAQTLQGVVEDYSADRDQRAGERSARDQMAALLSGDTPSAAPAAAPVPGPASAPATLDAGTGGMPKYASAISSIESGGQKDPYASLGPETKGDRPYGRYQVMGANVGPWSKAALGRELSPQEFLSDPQAQDAVFNHRFGQYVDKYGPEGAARAWFAGEGGMNSPGRRDVLGTSVADYGRKFNASLGDQPQATPAATPAAAALAPVTPAAAPAGTRRFDSAKLAAVLSNPYATPAQQQIASALLKQQLEPDKRELVKDAEGRPIATYDARGGSVAPLRGADTINFGRKKTDLEAKLDAAGITDPGERQRLIRNDIEGNNKKLDIERKLDAAGVTDPAERSRIIKTDIEGTDSKDPSSVGEYKYYLENVPKGEKPISYADFRNKTGEPLDDKTLSAMARQALAGDMSVFQNIGRGAQGAETLKKLRTKMYETADDMGISPEQVAHRIAEFQGDKASERTLGTRSANLALASTEASNLIPLVNQISDKIDRTQYPTINSLLLAAQKGTGGEDVIRLGIAVESLVRTYARALSPTGTPSVSDNEHARELLNKAWSKGQIHAATDQMDKEIKRAEGALKQTKDKMRDVNTAPGPKPTGGADAAPVQVKSIDEARALPKGTKIILPDGSPGVVP